MNKQSRRTHEGVSLSEVHESVVVPSRGSKWVRWLAITGPALLVSVGYMDPGNWATDLAGGSQYNYTLIWVLLMSNLMAILLQSLAARLGHRQPARPRPGQPRGIPSGGQHPALHPGRDRHHRHRPGGGLGLGGRPADALRLAADLRRDRDGVRRPAPAPALERGHPQAGERGAGPGRHHRHRLPDRDHPWPARLGRHCARLRSLASGCQRAATSPSAFSARP